MNQLTTSITHMTDELPPIKKWEYDRATKQLTIYCNDGSVWRIQATQIN